MKEEKRKFLTLKSSLLAAFLLLSSGLIKAENYNQAPSIKQGAILHAWCWSFNTIKNNMQAIAEAGYTAVQTSPVNKVREGDNGGLQLNGSGKWYYHYQPVDYTIGNYQLGTEQEFKDMCIEAHRYGVKVIVDAVINHCTSSYDLISQDIKNIQGGAFHSDCTINNYNSRKNVTQCKLSGLYDFNTQNPNVQNYLLAYLNRCLAAGADGFRYDAAKHIELPEDDAEFKSNFIPAITNNNAEFQYLEVLQGEDIVRMDHYSKYASVTASYYGNRIRSFIRNKNLSADRLADFNSGGAPADKLVTWVESHDNYCNDGSWDQLNDQQIKWGWAIIAARKDGTPLFYSRPNNGGPGNQWGNNQIGPIGSSLFKDAEIVAVNKFRNAMAGESDKISNPTGSNDVVMIERSNRGVVIINLSNSAINMDVATVLSDHTFTEMVTGEEFQVSGGKLKGTLKANQIAVMFREYGVGINDPLPDEMHITIDPNPATDIVRLSIEKNTNNLTYQIYDLNGKLHSAGAITSSETFINIRDLISGTYFLKILENNNEVKTLKLIRK